MSEIPEYELIRRVRESNSAACEILYRLYEWPAFSMGLRVTARETRAGGPAQESFLQRYRRIDTFRENSPLSRWLSRVVARLMVNSGSGAGFRRLAAWRDARTEFPTWMVGRRTLLIRTW